MNHPESMSYWEQKTLLPHSDFAIIGSGIVGLNAALHLRTLQPRARIHVYERGPLPEGASTRNAGFACFGSMTELLSDMQTQSLDEVFDVVALRFEGLKVLRRVCGDQHLKYKNLGGFELFLDHESSVFEQCEAQLPLFNAAMEERLQLKNTYKTLQHPAKFGFSSVKHIIKNQHEGQLDTGKMMQRLLDLAQKANIRIFNGLQITSLAPEVNKVTLETKDGWSLTCGQLLVASNGFAKHLLPELEVQPARNQVLITAPIANLPFKGCFHYDQGYVYFRNVKDRILLGGARNKALAQESTDLFGSNEEVYNILEQLLHNIILPDRGKIQIDARWSGILGLGAIKRPIIRKLHPQITVAVRMGGMGVAIGALVGQQAAELSNSLV